MPLIVYCTVALTLFSDSVNYIAFLFSECCSREQITGIAMVSERDFDNLTFVSSCEVYTL